MAAKTTSKKKSGAQTKAAGTKTAPRKTAPRKRAAEKADKPAFSPVKRAVAGIVCLLLALCVCVSYFQTDALLLDFLSTSLRGLLGYAWYLMAPALLWASLVLLLHHGQPVRLRTISILLLPLLLGCILHLLLCKNTYDSGLGIFASLWKDGQTLACGGALCGSIAVGFAAVLSKVVSIIIFAVLVIAGLFAALHVTPAEVVERAREIAAERAQDDDGDEDFGFPASPVMARTAEKKAPEKKPEPARRSPIDIPLDDEPRTAAPAPAAPAPVSAAEALKEKTHSFFTRRSAEVKTPAEVIAPEKATPAEPVKPAVEAPAAPAEEKKPRRSRSEVSRQEMQEVTEAVSAEIEQELAETEPAYQYPPITLLNENTTSNYTEVGAELRNNSRRLAQTLQSFGVDAQPGEVVHGPSVTRYEFTLDQGVKLSKITNLSDDIALALGASGVRIAPIPNKISVVGIEVPNRAVTAVYIRDVIESETFVNHPSTVAFAIGKDIGGNHIVGNIAKLPHVLIAGTTGSGKSVCTNSLIVSLLYKSTPDEVRFIMVDPKMVELAPYNGIPHLLIPVVTDPKKAAGALQWAVFEMMKRYKMFSEHGVKDLAGFNALAESEAGKADGLKKMPTVVVVIDELADLMLVAAKEVEESICRVAQMGRAAGMHLVIATQRPSADVITGLMKANIPSRIAFAVASSLESRIILDNPGAEKLVGKGDMLYAPLGAGKPVRVQGCLISPDEIERVVEFCKQSGGAAYDQSVIDKIEEALKKDEKGSKGEAGAAAGEDKDDADELLPAAVEVILETGQASVSMLQRRLKLGYSRAARLVDQMEELGIVGPFEGSKPRQLLITRAQWQEMQMKRSGGEAEQPPEIDRYGTISDQFESHDALED